ncbi:hypothetical protein C3R44_23010, partial [Mycobacterium tuberculosis]
CHSVCSLLALRRPAHDAPPPSRSRARPLRSLSCAPALAPPGPPSAASLPLALAAFLPPGAAPPGALALLLGSGAGLRSAAPVVRLPPGCARAARRSPGLRRAGRSCRGCRPAPRRPRRPRRPR